MTIKINYLTVFYRIALIILGISALIGPAIFNGFPLVYSDSGTYIAAAKTHSIPVDRPVVYSLFLNAVSLNITLWLVVAVQCIILLYLIYLLFKYVFKIDRSLEWASATTFMLSFTTSISNYSSQLMPDIFAAWMLLSLFILLFNKGLSTSIKVFLWLVFLLSVTSHLSILLSATILVLICLTINLIFKILPSPQNRHLIILMLVGWLIIPVINSSYGVGFTVSRCRNVSLMARLVETGVVKEFLHENCKNHNYSLCEYKDSLPEYGYQFAWEPTSPLYKGACWATGWGNCWIERDKEYGELIKDLVNTPKYLKKLIIISIRDTYRQLLDFRIGMLVPMKERTAPYETIKTFYPQDLNAYKKADQLNKTLYFNGINKIQGIFIFITILTIPFLLLLYRKKAHQLKDFYFLTGIVISGLLINAAVCSSFSTVVDRYQSRVIWLVPFLLFGLIASLCSYKPINKKLNQ